MTLHIHSPAEETEHQHTYPFHQHQTAPSMHNQKTSIPSVNHAKLQELGRELLLALGEDPEREGLQETPRRWADWWQEFIEYDPGKTATSFRTVTTDQLVCVSGLRVFSLCEHHLLPMWCDISIGYIPTETILGLSKFARIAHQYAHQLQIQERLGQQIADEITRLTTSPHVAVILKGEHLCLSARGIRTPGVMHSTVMRGAFTHNNDYLTTLLHVLKG